MKTLSERLQYLINNKGVTPYFVSKETGLSEATLSRILSNKSKKLNMNTYNILADYFNVSKDWLLTGNGEMLKTEDKQEYVPLLPISAQGGSLNDFNPSTWELKTEEIISPIKNVDFAITVTGDSMYPDYPHGSKVFIKKVNEKIFLQWGEVYVLDTENGIIIKKIHKTDDENIILCQSINQEFADFTINIIDIRGFYKVLLVMSLK